MPATHRQPANHPTTPAPPVMTSGSVSSTRLVQRLSSSASDSNDMTCIVFCVIFVTNKQKGNSYSIVSIVATLWESAGPNERTSKQQAPSKHPASTQQAKQQASRHLSLVQQLSHSFIPLTLCTKPFPHSLTSAPTMAAQLPSVRMFLTRGLLSPSTVTMLAICDNKSVRCESV